MTVIAIVKNRKGKLMIAGDRRASWGYHYAQSMETPKINKKEGLLLGATGDGDLCSLFVGDDTFEIPDRKVKSINKYMTFIFKPAVLDFLINQGYGYKDSNKNKILGFPPHTFCEVVIGLDGQVWNMVVGNPLEDGDSMAGHVSLGRISSPYSTGCGGQGTPDGIFKYLLKTKGYITEKDLRMSLEIVSDISPGCDDQVDIITED